MEIGILLIAIFIVFILRVSRNADNEVAPGCGLIGLIFFGIVTFAVIAISIDTKAQQTGVIPGVDPMPSIFSEEFDDWWDKQVQSLK